MKNFKAIKRVQAGFTLIELMIVVAIVAILVALALPAYQDYSIRAKVTECIDQAASAKIGVTEFYQSTGGLPATSAQAGIENFEATQYCASMTVGAAGLITITTTNTGASSAPAMTLTPNTGTLNVTSWTCRKTGGITNHVPASCRNT